MFRRKIKAALFVDFHNIVGKVAGGGFTERLPHWLGWLEDGRFDPRKRKRLFLKKYVYLTIPFERQAAAFQNAGFVVIPTAEDDVIKFDMIESVYRNRNVKEYVLLTVDGDFDQLLERLGERKKDRVVTIEAGAPCASTFPPLSEITMPLDNLKGALQYRRKRALRYRAGDLVRPLWNRADNAGRWVVSRIYERYRLIRRRAIDRQTLRLVANHVATLAHKRPGLPVGRRTVLRYLEGNMPELKNIGRFAGCASYTEMIQKIVAIRPDLALFHEPTGGMVITVPRQVDRD